MDKIIELILILAIAGSTLAFGGVEPLAYTLMEVGIFLAFLLLLWKQERQGKIDLPLPLWPALFALLIVVQAIPLPSRFILKLSPARLLAPLGGVPPGEHAWTTLSIYPHDTVLTLIRFLAYLCAFLVAACLFDSRKRKSALLQALILLGCFEAAYGIFQYLTGWQRIFTYAKVYDVAEATGTYINRNHFAGLLELTLPFVMASAFYSFQLWSERRHAGSSRRAPAGDITTGYQLLFYLFLLAIMVVAVVFSRSRSGILITLFTLALIAVLAQLKARRKIWMLAIFLFFTCVVGFGLWIGLNPVLSRFDEGTSLGVQGRISLWKDELRPVRDYPLLGLGLGTFGVGFRRYQTTLVEAFVDHAHNDYLEFASETGLLGAAVLFLPILYLLIRMSISFLDDPRRYRRSVTLGCIGSALALLLHSVSDFNLQIPANALIFAVVLGIGYKSACLERSSETPAGGRPARATPTSSRYAAA